MSVIEFPRATAKKTITSSEKLQIIGLLTLASKHTKMLTDIVDSLSTLTGEERGDHCSDAVYGHEDVAAEREADSLLERLGLVVED